MNSGWHVMEHGSLLQLAHNLWWVDGAVPRMALRRSCTVVRRNTGGLVVHSAICLDESTQAHLEALGPVEHVVVPGAMHRLDAPRYAERYPAAHVVAPTSVREKVEEVVRVDLTTDEFPNGEDVTMLPLAGVAGREFVMQVRSDDGVTLVFNDALFNVPHTGGAGGWMLRLMGSSGGPRATPLARMLLYTDRSAAREAFLQFAETPDLVRVIPGHGAVIDDAPADVLRAVAETF